MNNETPFVRNYVIEAFLLLLLLVFIFTGVADAERLNITNSSAVTSSFPDINYGSDTNLYLLNSSFFGGAYKQSYIELPENQSNLILSLYIDHGGIPENWDYNIYNTLAFDENTITWNNKPGILNTIGSFSVESDFVGWKNITLVGAYKYIVIDSITDSMFTDWVDSDDGVNIPYISISTLPTFDPSGYVNDTNGNPLYNAKVQLSNATWTDPCTAGCFTNTAGYWNTNIYENGTYNYNVSLNGFTTLSGSQLFNITGTNYNFTLTANAGMLYGTVYEWTNGTAPQFGTFDLRGYNSVSTTSTGDGCQAIYAGSTLSWLDGYVWRVRDVDSANAMAYITLLHNGTDVYTEIIRKGERAIYPVYEDSDTIIAITLDVCGVFSGRETNTVWAKPGQALHVKTTFDKIVVWILRFYAGSTFSSVYNILQYSVGTQNTNLALWSQMKADAIDDLQAKPVTPQNPCGGDYYNAGVTQENYFTVLLTFPENGTYNLIDGHFRLAAPGGSSRTIGYAFTDDDLSFPDNSMFPNEGYRQITGITDSCPKGGYPTASENFSTLDANHNKQLKLWIKVYSGANGSAPLYVYKQTYVSAACVNCNNKPLDGAMVYYNYLSKTYIAITNALGNYNISIPLNIATLVRYTKTGYENKNLTFTFASVNQTQKAPDVIINKTTQPPITNIEDIWVQPPVITYGQQGAVYYRTLGQNEYQIIIQMFGEDYILQTFPISSNTESFENLPSLAPGYYQAILQGGCYFCSWVNIKTANFTIRSKIPVASWSSTEYYLGSVMKLVVDIPVGVSNQVVTAYFPNGSVMYNNSHSATDGIQTILFNTSFGGAYPPGKYVAMITGNSNQSVTTLYNINLTNYSLEAPASAVWGTTIAIKYLSPRQSEFHIYTSDGLDAIKSFVVQSSGTYLFNTSKLSNKADTLTVKLIQNNVEMKKIDIQITKGAVDSTGTGQATAIATLLGSNIFWALIIVFGMMTTTAVLLAQANIPNGELAIGIVGVLGVSVFTIGGWIPAWLTFSIIILIFVIFAWQQANHPKTGG